MTGYSSSFFLESNPGLIDRFEKMIKARTSFFFDVDEIETLADHYLEKGNHEKAKFAIGHGLSIHPKSPALLLKEAHALLFVNQAEKALEILNFLEASEPTNTEMLLFKAVVHRNLSDYEGTKACLIKALNATPDNKEEIYLDLAFEQEMVEDYSGAISSLKQSLEINPNHDPSLFELGYCFDMAEDLDNGVTFFKSYLDENPYNFVGWYNLALCYEKLSLFELAIETVGFAIAIKPDFTNAFILKGNMYTSCDLDYHAIEAYKDALTFDESPLLFAAIGECYERLSLWDDAKEHYQKALTLDANYVDAMMGMGSFHENNTDYTTALEFYRQATDEDVLNIDNWHIYGEALVKVELYTEAEKVYKHITKCFGDDEEAWIALAEIHAKIKNNGSAVDTLKSGKEVISSSGDIEMQLAKYLILDGKVDEGVEILAPILSNNENNSNYFLSIFPEAIQIPNIAALIETHPSE